MKHLTDDEIYRLAELTEECEPYNDVEMEQMEHLKTCTECFDKFCVTLALLEVTNESGYMVLSEIYEQSRIRSLAVLMVIRKTVESVRTAVIEQANQMGALLQFEPPLAFATRGTGEGTEKISKVEDVEDEKTFVLFDSERNELLVQVNLKDRDEKNIRISLEFENGDISEVPVEKKGNLVKGIIDNLPEMNFEIHIENIEG